jgi:hypothetical protein
MRRNWLIVALILLCMTALAVQVSLAKEEPAELQGESVKITDLIQKTAEFVGTNVVIEGKIETECPAGCWFIVNDGDASLYIDILPSNFVIPQEAGSKVKVYGEVTLKDNDPMMIGKIVEINGEVYR